MIVDPTDNEVRSAIRFFKARNMKRVEIHRQLVEIYGENVMNDGMVKKGLDQGWPRQMTLPATSERHYSLAGRT
ncbi:hypothetical protein TNCV_1642491 [Trichonephila clavipes]|nr:hypothetical protein TNCV_1642491 [Trichonephila clavipes]